MCTCTVLWGKRCVSFLNTDGENNMSEKYNPTDTTGISMKNKHASEWCLIKLYFYSEKKMLQKILKEMSKILLFVSPVRGLLYAYKSVILNV